MLSRRSIRTVFLAAAIGCGLSTGAFAQASGAGTPAGPAATPAEPATPPAPGKPGDAPGNQGATGWTGGTGGSFTGTSQHAPTPGSKTDQPETATGLDPTKPK